MTKKTEFTLVRNGDGSYQMIETDPDGSREEVLTASYERVEDLRDDLQQMLAALDKEPVRYCEKSDTFQPTAN